VAAAEREASERTNVAKLLLPLLKPATLYFVVKLLAAVAVAGVAAAMPLPVVVARLLALTGCCLLHGESS
jgi:hypothetical protein